MLTTSRGLSKLIVVRLLSLIDCLFLFEVTSGGFFEFDGDLGGVAISLRKKISIVAISCSECSNTGSEDFFI